MLRRLIATAVLLGTAAFAAEAAETRATMRLATPDGPGAVIGTVIVRSAPIGTAFVVDVHGLPPGPHGFHVHENGTCDKSVIDGRVVPAGAAGGHLDPEKTEHHGGPEGPGHLGDLPLLTADAAGVSQQTVVAPRIGDMSILGARAVMIHAGGDNYADSPAPLGGGGARFACGVLD